MINRFLFAIGVVVSLATLIGCDQSSAPLTPAQQQQVDAARQAAIVTCERALGRPLTDSEKECVEIEMKDGRIVGNIAPPLSEMLKNR